MIRISIRRKIEDEIIPPPAGYSIFTVKRWGDPVMVEQGDFDTTIRGEVGQFQVINLIIYGRGPGDLVDQWSGELSAVSQFNTLGHSDIMKLANMQIIPFGYEYGMTDAELMAVKDAKLPDGYSLHQKMNWLVNPEGDTTRPSTVMWANGFWYEATWIRYGTMVNGGQKVAASPQIHEVRTQLKHMSSPGLVRCRKLLPFRRLDFGKPNATHPWLLQYATVANHPGNGYGDYIRGHVMCPVALDSNDFDFSGLFKPSTYYIPVDWME